MLREDVDYQSENLVAFGMDQAFMLMEMRIVSVWVAWSTNSYGQLMSG